ncbi:DUF2157 domain-containing protein [Bizionia paragorgiae]|uniref:DUF2157 domain-containing protein n=1 Tax=Bizionia paragorgiae TaxID=283786 RepID=UPI00299E184E|nr:DUF2157 domain-containing protein [Bizionia paragorgiae]MDX1272688.1 DUF2157 domain-containing protein [Bizionia paragorgiae]
MIKLDKEDIELLSRHSNWSEKNVEHALKTTIYSTKTDWQNFLKLVFLSLGIGFSVAGIIFFFAYNWADLHKFVKIGLIEGLIIITTLIAVFSKLQAPVKNAILTGAALLVGVLFAVFGQIYQTGANAYDFFLGWTLCITLWVVVSNSAPLWLIYIVLINTTVVLYAQQVAHDWSFLFICLLLFLINSVFLIAALFLNRTKAPLKLSNWFTNTIALGSICYSTIGLCYGLFESPQFEFYILLIVVLIAYSAAIKYGLQSKNTFYLAVIPFSVIIIISALFVKISDDFGMFLFIGLFVVISVTLVIKNLINLQRSWTK